MKAAISRSYHVMVYPYDNDDEHHSSFSITPEMVNEHTIRIYLGCDDGFEYPVYLGICEQDLLFIDTGKRRGLTIPLPDSADQVYEYFEEFDEYDEHQCAVLAETVFILYHDIWNPLHTISEEPSA